MCTSYTIQSLYTAACNKRVFVVVPRVFRLSSLICSATRTVTVSLVRIVVVVVVVSVLAAVLFISLN